VAGGLFCAMSMSPSTSERDDWTMSLAFWGTLLVAGILFAAVSLAPKLKTLGDLREEYAANQRRLVALERQADELERVAEALEHDPAFAAELAKVEFAAGRPGRERIVVPADLRLGAETAPSPVPSATPVRSPLPAFVLEPLATHGGLRMTLLATAATLVLVAFLVLHEEQAATVRAVLVRGRHLFTRVRDRYRKSPSKPRL